MKTNSLESSDEYTSLHNTPALQKKLTNYISRNHCTLLAVGPVSVNCVDVAVEISNEYQIPVMLIASRRQIDSAAHGAGYVNGWTTCEFSRYVRQKDSMGKVLLARDHGGPWQNPVEIQRNDSIDEAMQSAKDSYQKDIDAGFNILHIDPSIDIHENPELDVIIDRVLELYHFCSNYAAKKKRHVLFEVGTEEQSGLIDKNDDLEYLLSKITGFCNEKKLFLPTFVVVQIGTKVMETKNIGLFESAINNPEINSHKYQQISKIVEICNRSRIHVKVHNGDYLSDEAIKLHPKLGIHAANVAPEFAVTETRTFVSILEKESLNKLLDQFLELSYNSMKWEKWMMEDTQASDRDRAIISGHYVFSTPEFCEIKQKANHYLSIKNINVDQALKQQIKKQMMRYVRGFNLV